MTKSKMVVLGLIAALTIAILVLGFMPQRADLHYMGRTHQVKLPHFSIPLGSDDSSASYLLIGDRDLASWLRAEAKEKGWTYVEQLGSHHSLRLAGGSRLGVSRRQWGAGFLVRIELWLYSP